MKALGVLVLSGLALSATISAQTAADTIKWALAAALLLLVTAPR